MSWKPGRTGECRFASRREAAGRFRGLKQCVRGSLHLSATIALYACDTVGSRLCAVQPARSVEAQRCNGYTAASRVLPAAAVPWYFDMLW